MSIAQCFPVVVPPDFSPSDADDDGDDMRWDGKPCPCQEPPHLPRFGGGFHDARGEHRHTAIDIMAAEGSLVVAPCDGIVPDRVRMKLDGKSGPHPGAGTGKKAGNYVCVESDGWRWYMSHLRDVPLVGAGTCVTAGTPLGYVGRTGNAVRTYQGKDGRILRGCPHLHLALTALTSENVRQARREGLDVLGRKVDPVPVLRPLYEAGGWRG